MEVIFGQCCSADAGFLAQNFTLDAQQFCLAPDARSRCSSIAYTRLTPASAAPHPPFIAPPSRRGPGTGPSCRGLLVTRLSHCGSASWRCCAQNIHAMRALENDAPLERPLHQRGRGRSPKQRHPTARIPAIVIELRTSRREDPRPGGGPRLGGLCLRSSRNLAVSSELGKLNPNEEAFPTRAIFAGDGLVAFVATMPDR